LRLHLDLFSGIAGNMFLGALLDAGLSRRALAADLAGLRLPHTLRVRRVRRGALSALYVSVDVPAARDAPKRRPAKAARRARAGAHAHDHDHRGDREPGHGHAPGRHYDEIRRLLDRARLAPAVRDRAQAIFAALARAEARVHGIPIEQVHFHEVGAVDAIVDVTGAAIAVERLGVRAISASPVALGHGSVGSDHGRLPLPAPATLELLRGVPTAPAGVAWETVTPTGAAILRTLAEDFGPLPAMTVERIGCGAGDDRPGPMPNVLRAVLGSDSEVRHERVSILECNLDDVVPEHFDHWMERLLAAGALDVSLQHVQTKKNRPGFLVRVICRPSERGALARVLLQETTTLGVRTADWDRLALPRETRRIETPFGRISVKFARRPGGQLDVSAEVDDCRRAAVRAGTPLREVVRVVEETARARLAEGRSPDRVTRRKPRLR
jgi:pyridinium-3,5-bisthiocarboxylic acid mononucleotide nickel chelatase